MVPAENVHTQKHVCMVDNILRCFYTAGGFQSNFVQSAVEHIESRLGFH